MALCSQDIKINFYTNLLTTEYFIAWRLTVQQVTLSLHRTPKCCLFCSSQPGDKSTLCSIARLLELLNVLNPILPSPVAAAGWWYGAELVYCGWWWYRRSSSWGGSCCMNCPCGVHVPTDNRQRSCIPLYFVTCINRIHNT